MIGRSRPLPCPVPPAATRGHRGELVGFLAAATARHGGPRKARRCAQRHVATLHRAGQTVLLHPYQQAVDIAGETAMVFLGDRYSHAVRKQSLLAADAGVADRLWEPDVIAATAPPAGPRQPARPPQAIDY